MIENYDQPRLLCLLFSVKSVGGLLRFAFFRHDSGFLRNDNVERWLVSLTVSSILGHITYFDCIGCWKAKWCNAEPWRAGSDPGENPPQQGRAG